MGIYCTAGGQKAVAAPGTALFNGPPNPQAFRDICAAECWCVDLGPDTPTQVQAQRPERCSTDEADPAPDPAATATCEGFQFRNPIRQDNIRCDLFYGQPSAQSCDAAHALIGTEEKDPVEESREFLTQEVSPAYNGFKLERTPQYYPTDATAAHECTIAIDMIDGTGNNPRFRANDLENWDYLWGRADAVIEKCVKGLGVGGWTTAGEQDNAMGVYVYGPLSQYAQFLAIKYHCETNAEGSAQCDSDAPDPKRQKTGPGDVSSSGAGTSSTAQSAPVAEGAPCYKPSDCDAANDYICATDKSVPGDSTSWGTFTCRYFPNAGSIVAAVATTIRVGTCRGRCLLGAGGTLEIPINDNVPPVAAPAKTLSHTVEASLSCPCNCTYVSHACCLSGDGMVAEDAGQEIVTTQLPPNGSVCCDAATGNWAVSGVQTDTVSKEGAMCATGPATINTRSEGLDRAGDGGRAIKGRSRKLW
ncbi:MAG: hypothetical protein Q9208_003836 [Pyrenodesmia sp. 3 TL-2023]